MSLFLSCSVIVCSEFGVW